MMFLALALLCGFLFLYPYLIYPVVLRFLRPQPYNLSQDAPLPTATLVFCAFNESATLADKIANLRAIKEVVPNIQFKAYVDLSTDDTLAILQQHSDLIDVHAAQERTGKALGMRRLAAASTTDIMIFTDANVMVEPETVPRMLRYFSEPSIGGVCGSLVYVNPDESVTASVNSAYWRLEEYIKKSESRSGSTMGGDGSLFATRRSLYPEVPPHLLDDFIVSMSTIFAGFRLISAPDVIAYERSAAGSGDEFKRKRRIACRAYSSHRYLVPSLRRMTLLNRYKYVSHRLIRWYGAMFAILSVVFGVLWIGETAGLLWGAVALACIAAIMAMILASKKKQSRIAELVRAVWATMLGIIDARRGKIYQTWQPAQSR